MIGLMRRDIIPKMKVRVQLPALILAIWVTNACVPPVDSAATFGQVSDDLYFVRGYSSESDPCKLTGETGFTNQFLDDSADLVSCPMGYEGGDKLVDTRHATVVAETGGYTLYSVPRR